MYKKVPKGKAQFLLFLHKKLNFDEYVSFLSNENLDRMLKNNPEDKMEIAFKIYSCLDNQPNPSNRYSLLLNDPPQRSLITSSLICDNFNASHFKMVPDFFFYSTVYDILSLPNLNNIITTELASYDPYGSQNTQKYIITRILIEHLTTFSINSPINELHSAVETMKEFKPLKPWIRTMSPLYCSF